MVLGGDPGRAPTDVTLENWQSAAQLHWAFQHIADFLPTAVISRGTGPVAELPPAPPGELSDIPLFDRTNGKRTTVGDVMAATATDGWIVTRDGKVLEEHYYGGMSADTSHLLMSVSKSLIAMVVGALVSDGALNVDARADDLCSGTGELGLRRRDGAPSARHALGHRVFRGLPQPDGRGATARAGHWLGAADGAGPADHHVRLPGHAETENAAWRPVPSTGPARRTCWAGYAKRPAGFGCPS